MNKLLATASFIALTAVSGQALANNHEVFPHWYVGLSGGVTYLDDSDVSGAATGTMGYDTGWGANAAIGYILPFGHQDGNVRLEFEAGYRENSLDTVLGTASPGRTRIASYMFNGYYDFRSEYTRLTPYIGAGIGVAQVGISHDSGLGNTGDDEDTVLAYQGMAGVAYAPSGMPNTEFTLGYRYFVAHDPEYTVGANKAKLDDVTSHSAEIGGRFKF